MEIKWLMTVVILCVIVLRLHPADHACRRKKMVIMAGCLQAGQQSGLSHIHRQKTRQ